MQDLEEVRSNLIKFGVAILKGANDSLAKDHHVVFTDDILDKLKILMPLILICN